jgi:hypothetical protein
MKQLFTILGIIYLTVVNFQPLCAQDDFIKMMNDTIHSIKYVFEARIDSVQIFAGDKDGKPVQFGTAEWKGEGGNFDAISYSRVWVTVCRQYKGKVPHKMIFLISNPYISMYAIAHNGDTTLGYIHSPPSHGDRGSPLMPSKSYPITNLYWCFDVSPIGKTKYHKISKFIEFPMKMKGSIPNSHGYYDAGIIYAWTGTKTFMTQAELSNYLENIDTLKANPKSLCD